MRRTEYLEFSVEADLQGWTICLGGARHGYYRERREAMRVAIAHAMQAARRGHRTRVLARKRDGKLREIWNDSRQAQPPATNRGANEAS